MMNGVKHLFKKTDIDWHEVKTSIFLLIYLIIMVSFPLILF